MKLLTYSLVVLIFTSCGPSIRDRVSVLLVGFHVNRVMVEVDRVVNQVESAMEK